MRIVAGKYRGRVLVSSKDQSIRPTTNKIKEYIFNILRDRVEDARVLDLFSGAGSLGLEALSRGAAEATFVDNTPNSLRILKKNISHAKIAEPTTTLCRDAIRFLKTNTHTYDIIFADPSYRWKSFDQLMPLIFKANTLSETGLFVLESEQEHAITWETEAYTVYRQKKFDRCYITFLSRRGSE